ncbi:MAG: hypothetical protein MZV63_44780, partial [Marinilabiliales bacterium]|nr:hypothetical protein [Marinilabiliales bacterium]
EHILLRLNRRLQTESTAPTGYGVYIGAYAGAYAQGTGNVFIKDSAGYNETGSNKLYISNSKMALNTPLIYAANLIINF